MTELAAQPEGYRYTKDLPTDRTNFAKAWHLFEVYSHIPPNEIDAHVTGVRDKAFAIFHYPCLGRWRFLDLYIASSPLYPAILSRLKSGDKLLDVGACFGHILRQLAFDGAPSQNLAGTDLRPEFIELGYELFRDKETFGAEFVSGDALDPENQSLKVLDGRFDIVHAASFFHLFGWDEQVKVGERIVKFLKPDAKNSFVLGRQVGTREPLSLEAYREKGEHRYLHDVKTFQALWDEIGAKTGTKWKASGSWWILGLRVRGRGFRGRCLHSQSTGLTKINSASVVEGLVWDFIYSSTSYLRLRAKF